MIAQHITASELSHWLSDASRTAPLLLDVREPSEVERCMIPGSIHIPMQTVPSRLSELDQEAAIVCICHHGARSLQVLRYLNQFGFDNVINLSGGIHAWAIQVDPSMATY